LVFKKSNYKLHDLRVNSAIGIFPPIFHLKKKIIPKQTNIGIKTARKEIRQM
jgi:hypothetical protein